MKCKTCNGNGWHEDHSDSHYCNNDSKKEDCYHHGCPVLRQCEKCLGTGKTEED